MKPRAYPPIGVTPFGRKRPNIHIWSRLPPLAFRTIEWAPARGNVGIIRSPIRASILPDYIWVMEVEPSRAATRFRDVSHRKSRHKFKGLRRPACCLHHGHPPSPEGVRPCGMRTPVLPAQNSALRQHHERGATALFRGTENSRAGHIVFDAAEKS
jgi:hypothetical protein